MAGESSDQQATARATGAPTPPVRRSLLVMIGDEVEARPLPLTGAVMVGRSTGCDIRIDHPSISRSHVQIVLGDSGLELRDQGGSNGTSLRGVKLPASVAVAVSPNEPFKVGDVVLAIQEVRAVGGSTAAAPRPSGQVSPTSAPVVLDPAMKAVYELGGRVARGAIGVLLVGETGAGKEVLAEHIHRSSPRARGPLVRVNCAALTDTLIESELFGHVKGAFTGAEKDRRGLIETADGGTVFLDEVGEISAAVQAKLLRVLEERRILPVGGSESRPIDVRFVAATNRDLEVEVAAGRFRRDLYYRLAGAVLAIPPLRDRPLEIAALARRFAGDVGITDGAIESLRTHAWPGNVRELRNVIERALLLIDGGAIDREHLSLAPSSAAQPAVAADVPLPDQLAALERQRILDALEQCAGNQTRAAKLLGMPLRTFIKRIESYGIPRPRKK